MGGSIGTPRTTYRDNDIPEDSTTARLDIVDCRLEKLESLAGSATAWRRFTYIMAGLLVFTVIGSVASCAHVKASAAKCTDSMKVISIPMASEHHYTDEVVCESSLHKGVVTREGQTTILACQCR